MKHGKRIKGTLLIAAGIMLVSITGHAEDVKKARLAVFPFEGVNVDQSVLDASREVFTAAMIQEGFTVMDSKRIARATAELEEAPQPLPVKEPAPPAPAPDTEVDTDDPDTASPLSPKDSESPEPVETPAPEKPVVVDTVLASEPLEPTHQEIAARLQCDYYVIGKLVKLGARTQVAISIYNADGEAVDSKKMTASTEDELNVVFDRIAEAFARGIAPSKTRTLYNATSAETDEVPRLERVSSNHGMVMGGGFMFGDNVHAATTMLAYEGLWEQRNLRAGVNAGFAMASHIDKTTGDNDSVFDNDDEFDFAVFMDIIIGGYLTQSRVSPYLGGGLGAYLGTRPTINHWDDMSSGSAMGFDVFAQFGLELLRTARIRLHPEVRYLMAIDLDGNIGHGPSILIGLNF